MATTTILETGLVDNDAETSGGDITFARHLISAQGQGAQQDAVPATSNLGVNITSVTPSPGSNDYRGIVNIVVAAGGLAANTRIATITYNRPYFVAPAPLLVDETVTAGLAVVNFYFAAQTVAAFDLFCDQALVAGTYRFSYIVTG